MSKLITVFDTTVTDDNLGNEIIMTAVWKYLRQTMPDDFFIKLPYLDTIGYKSIHYIQNSDLVFFGGTNCLTSNMERYRQWGIDRSNADKISGVILMGVGWWQYQDDPTKYTQKLLRAVLNHDLYHSVRDKYTANKLRGLGFENVVVTGCPSMWCLTSEHCKYIPTHKAKNVLVTFTSYNQSKEDLAVVNILKKYYHKIYCWIQGPEDAQYISKLLPDVEIVNPNTDSLDGILSSDLDLDYVGTRLHAGIRALQCKRRSIIISIDNRAAEISNDFNLPVVARNNNAALESMIVSDFETNVKIPVLEIKQWLDQFKSGTQMYHKPIKYRYFPIKHDLNYLFWSGIHSLKDNGVIGTIINVKDKLKKEVS